MGKKKKFKAFTNLEYLQMVRMYAIANEDKLRARDMYAEPLHMEWLRSVGVREPTVPSARTIAFVVQRLLDSGSFAAPRRRGDLPAPAPAHGDGDGDGDEPT